MIKRKAWDIMLGMFFLLSLNVGYLCLVFFLVYVGVIRQILGGGNALISVVEAGFLILASAFTGLGQFTYAIPIYLRFRKKGRPNIAMGIAIAAILTLILSGFWLLFLFSIG